jgi:hypothetical protein
MSNSRTSQSVDTCSFWSTVWINSGLREFSLYHILFLPNAEFWTVVSSKAHNHPRADLTAEICFSLLCLTLCSWLDLMASICPWSNPTVNTSPPIYNVDPLRDFGTSGFDLFCSITHKLRRSLAVRRTWRLTLMHLFPDVMVGKVGLSSRADPMPQF